MPFDLDDRLGFGETPRERLDRKLVAGWLFTVCGMLLVMVALGGATRLTGSGLSIMEWAPLSGALPPWSDAEWRRLFTLYQGIPQYNLLHSGMELGGFKQIFWLEWTHRLWGRLIGVVFIVPLSVLGLRGAFGRRLWLRPTARRCRHIGWSSTWHSRCCFMRRFCGPRWACCGPAHGALPAARHSLGRLARAPC